MGKLKRSTKEGIEPSNTSKHPEESPRTPNFIGLKKHSVLSYENTFLDWSYSKTMGRLKKTTPSRDPILDSSDQELEIKEPSQSEDPFHGPTEKDNPGNHEKVIDETHDLQGNLTENAPLPSQKGEDEPPVTMTLLPTHLLEKTPSFPATQEDSPLEDTPHLETDSENSSNQVKD